MVAKLCKYGHFSEHGAQNKCLECARNRAKKFRSENPEHVRNVQRAHYAVNSETRCEQSKGYHAANPKKAMLRNAQKRARKDGYPCTITLENIVIPQFCPLLGTELRVSRDGVKPCSPSLDKIIPELGYVPGNVWVISHRANQIKSDATVQELKLLVTSLEKFVSVRQELIVPWAIVPPATKLESYPW